MKWLLLFSFLFCFSALAEVVCRAPGGGDDSSEGSTTSEICNPSSSGSSDNREVNTQGIVQTFVEGGTVGSENGGETSEETPQGVTQ